MTLTPNTLFKDRYLIKRVIAEGGMARVYEATDQLLEITVAIKQALFFHNPELRANFEREAKLLSILKHPSIPRVTDYFFTEEDGQFLIMDYIPGPNLHELLVERNKPFLPDEAIELLDQLLATLEFLHSPVSPIIHRNIKPRNLKLVDGQIKLLGFGLAKGTPAYSQMSSGKSLPAYTLSYAPLEQILAMGTDARSDLFSVGATLYHLLIGFSPKYDARVRKDLVDEGKPDPLQPPGVHPKIDTFVMRALALEAKDRFASATAMREILRQIKGAKIVPMPTGAKIVPMLTQPTFFISGFKDVPTFKTLTRNTLLKGRYLIKRVIAEGGMGRVYEATDQEFNSEVAIKQALSFHDPQLRATFEHEAKLLRFLNHSSIPKVTSFFTEEDGQFLIMDYIPGPNLDELLVQRNKPFPPDEAIELLDQLLATLEYLHNQASPIIHRDIKPLNLKVVDGQIKLLDFGLAKGTPAYSQMSSGKSLPAYTRSYAPLEQILALGTDARSDLFSAGATLYRLLVNYPPKYDSSVRKDLIDDGHPDPLKAPGVHPEIDTFVMRALALEAKDRFASATAMREILRQIKGMGPIKKNPPAPTETSSVVQEVPSIVPGQSGTVVSDPNSAEYQYKLGCALCKVKRYKEATAAFKEATKLNPSNADYRYWLGWVFFEQGKYEEAVVHFDEATMLDFRSNPLHFAYNNAEYLFYLGRTFTELSRHEEAVAAFKEALRLDPNKADYHKNLGDAFYKQNKYPEAVAAFKEALRLDPNNVSYHHLLEEAFYKGILETEAVVNLMETYNLDYPIRALDHNALGNAFYEQKSYPEAVAAYKEALRLDPNDATCHHNLGDAFYNQNKYPEAVTVYKEAIRLNPNKASYHHNLGDAFYKQEMYKEAAAAYKEALRLEPNNAMYHHSLGDAFYRQKKYPEAAAAYKEAIRLEPNNAMYHYNLGDAFLNRNKYPEAAAVYKEAIRLEPNNATYHHSLGDAFYRQKKYPEAAAAFKEAIRLEPNNATYHHNLGDAFYRQKKYPEADVAFKEAVKLEPNNAAYHNALGNAFYEQKSYPEAAAAYKEAIRLNPNNAAYHNALGWAFYKQKMYTEAIEAYKEALRLDPNNAAYQNDLGNVFYNLGNAFYKQKMYTEAIEAYKEAIRLNPNNAAYHNNLGLAFYKQSKCPEAVAAYEEAIRLEPGNAAYHNDLGNVFYRQKKYPEAVAAYKEAVRLKPGNSWYQKDLKNTLNAMKG